MNTAQQRRTHRPSPLTNDKTVLQENLHRTIAVFDESAANYENTIGSLPNYNHCYDAMISMMNSNDRVLDLACGPGNVSKYIRSRIQVRITGYDLSDAMLELARTNVPDGTFTNRSITEFDELERYDWVINAFGIPFLDKEMRKQCIQRSSMALKRNGHLYISFMDGSKEGYEKPPFSGDREIYFIYHDKREVLGDLNAHQFELVKEWHLDFAAENGETLKDVVLILRKASD